MSDGFGNSIYVYNPFTYAQLHEMAGAGTIDEYLTCISKMQVGISSDDPSVSCRKPSVPLIDEQGISVISVIERCRSNYQQMQWDAGAFMLYDRDRFAQVIKGTMIPPAMQEDATSDCLLKANENKESNLECMKVRLYTSGVPLLVLYLVQSVHPSLSLGRIEATL